MHNIISGDWRGVGYWRPGRLHFCLTKSCEMPDATLIPPFLLSLLIAAQPPLPFPPRYVRAKDQFD